MLCHYLCVAGKPRPVSLPVESLLSATDSGSRPAAAGRKGEQNQNQDLVQSETAAGRTHSCLCLISSWWKSTLCVCVCEKETRALCDVTNGHRRLPLPPATCSELSLPPAGCGVLHRYLSNEGISAIMEEEGGGSEGEEPRFPLPYRGHPLVRGVDHIRGSQCFVNADLHSSATIPYQEAAASKKASAPSPAPSPSGGAVAPPTALSKQSTSLLGGWLARLRLLSH